MTSNSEKAKEHILRGYKEILRGLTYMGYRADPVLCGTHGEEQDPNFTETPERATRGFLEMVHSESEVEDAISNMLKTFPLEEDNYGLEGPPGMVISSPTITVGLCPHHLLPVVYKISVGYIPKKVALGISKLNRIACLLAGRPVLQESIGRRLCAILYKDLDSLGAAAYIEGWHMCCAMRGTRHPEASVVTSEVCGAFVKEATRNEFLHTVRMNHHSGKPLL